jgi:hypothetical protein
MVDHKHKAIFVHVPKCAGASMQAALLLGNNDVEKYGRHPTIHDIREQLPKEVFDEYFSFAFIRNPFDRMVSAYAYFNKRTGIKGCFSDFVRKRGIYGTEYRRNKHDAAVHHMMGLRPITDFICDDSGYVVVDFVGRFETLYTDFEHVAKAIGLPPMLPRHLNVSSRYDDYRWYYTPRLRRIVEKCYKTDLIKFGYEF